MDRIIGKILSVFYGGEEGQTLTEYMLILILIAIVVIIILKSIGGQVESTYSTINSQLPM